MMDLEEDQINERKNKKSKRLEMEQKKKIQEQRQHTVQRMKNKIQKNWNRHARVNEADRKVPSKLPVHLNTGKRGIGKTDRR